MKKSLLFGLAIVMISLGNACKGGAGGGGDTGGDGSTTPTGNVAQGGSCSSNADCQSGLMCYEKVCAKVITDESGAVISAPGGTTAESGAIVTCEADSGCVSGLVCMDGICAVASESKDDGTVITDKILQLSPPEFSKLPGVYNSDISVIISSLDGAVIHYTDDGSEPSESSSELKGVIEIKGDGTKKTIRARAFKEGMLASDVSSAEYTISYLYADDPVFQPAGGTFDKDITVSITSASENANISYTTNGQEPTESSLKFIDLLAIKGNGTGVTIKAKAFKDGFKPSKVVSQTYNINYAAVSTPQFDPLAGNYDKDIKVNISTLTNGANVHYTEDGTEPTQNSALFVSPISIAGNTVKTIKAKAFKEGMTESSTAAGTFTVHYAQVAAPLFQLSEGTYNSDIEVALSSSDQNVKIFYTKDGSIPTKNSAQYSSPIKLSGEGHYTIKAIAAVDGGGQSAVVVASYIISYPKVAIPHFSPAAGGKGQDIKVSITTATEGAKIFYTEDGSQPDETSIEYSTPINIAGNGTTKTFVAKAFKSGFKPSDAMGAFYQINYYKVTKPVFSFSGGTYGKDIQVELSNSTTGSTIFYNTQGIEPAAFCNPAGCGASSADTQKYTGPIAVSGNGTSVTIKAIAVMNGIISSDVVSTIYNINYEKAAMPQFMPVPVDWQIYNQDKTVEISSLTPGAKIYYTLDGTEPSENSTLYSGPVVLNKDGEHTIKAKAFKFELASSDMASATYKISYKWEQISAGGGHTCAIRENDHSLWCWGNNGYGQLGFGDKLPRYKPEKVPVDGWWNSVSAGLASTCAIKSDTLWCWGANSAGQLGLGLAPGNVQEITSPQQVKPDKQWFKVSTGYGHACAIDTDLQLWCWGMGESGALGLGEEMKYAWEPMKIAAVDNESVSYWKDVSVGASHTCAIKAPEPSDLSYDGTLWCWGSNANGQLGFDMAKTPTLKVPGKVVEGKLWKSVSAGYEGTFAIDENSAVWWWGKFGQNKTAFPAQYGQNQWVSASFMYNHVCGRSTVSKAICLGDDTFGQLGKNGGIKDAMQWENVEAGDLYSCGIEKYDKTLWCWGANDYGQLGQGDNTPQSVIIGYYDENSDLITGGKIENDPECQKMPVEEKKANLCFIALSNGAPEQVLIK